MKKYIACLLASASILSAAEFDQHTTTHTTDYEIPNLAAPATPREQAEIIIARQLNQISTATATATLSPAETKIIELAMKVANLSDQATNIAREKLDQYTPGFSIYEPRLLELALSQPALFDKATKFIEFKLGQYTYLHNMPAHEIVDTEIFKLARNISSLSGLIGKLIKTKIGKYNKAVKTNASLCLPIDFPMILQSAMYNPLFSNQAIDIIEREMARYEASLTPPDLRIIKLALNNQRAIVLGQTSTTQDREQSKKLKELNEKAIDFIDNQLGQYIYTPTPASTHSMYGSDVVKLAAHDETLRPMALRFIEDELARLISPRTGTTMQLSPQSIGILRLATSLYTSTEQTFEQATNVIRTQLDVFSNTTTYNYEILRLALQSPARDQATDIIRSKLATLTTTTTTMSTPDIEILELAMQTTN